MTVSLQFISLLVMMACGILTATGVDAIRFLYSHAKPGSIIFRSSNVLEVAAWLLLGIGTFYVLFEIRDGAWRIYDPLAQIAGIFLYESIFQRPFRFTGRVIRNVLFRPIWLIIRFIIHVILKIVQVIQKILLLIVRPFKRLIELLTKTPLKKKRK